MFLSKQHITHFVLNYSDISSGVTLSHGLPAFFMAKGHTHYCRLVSGSHVKKLQLSGILNCLNYCGTFIEYTIYKCVHRPRNATWRATRDVWVGDPCLKWTLLYKCTVIVIHSQLSYRKKDTNIHFTHMLYNVHKLFS
jgi:hypothetical protein